jgi:MOSC domain-containing protein YiiM/ferredoxin
MPVTGRRRVGRLNIDGDGQGDLGGHGGEQRAVFVYQIASYRYWEQQLGRSGFVPGQFGENFTIEGLADDEVCIGARYRIGSALFEVTQPRVTCYRVGIRMEEPRMAALLTASNRTGFYLRVLEEGDVAAGDAIVAVAEGRNAMTVAEVNALLYSSRHPPDRLERVLRIAALSPGGAVLRGLAAQSGRAGQCGTGGAGPRRRSRLPAAAGGARRPGKRQHHLDRLQAPDGKALTLPLPGQFVVLRLHPAPDGPLLFRSYSLSGMPSDAAVPHQRQGGTGWRRGQLPGPSDARRRRAGGQRTARRLHLAAGGRAGRAAEFGRRRDAGAGDAACLVGAGIGPRKSGGCTARATAPRMPSRRSQAPAGRRCRTGAAAIWYSRPAAQDGLGRDYDVAGRMTIADLERMQVPRNCRFLPVRPARLPRRAAQRPGRLGRGRRAHPFRAVRRPARAHARHRRRRHAAPHQPDGSPGSGPLVSFARSGVTVRWRSQEQNLLELAEACDVPVRWSCRTGVCHNCESGLVSGAVDYEPDPLDPPAPGNILICCCRPKGDIVIDI